MPIEPAPPSLSDSTRRALRVIYWGVLAAIVVIPVFTGMLDELGWETAAKFAASLALVAGAIAKAVNQAEDAGLLSRVPLAPAKNSPAPAPSPVPPAGDEGHARVSLPIWTSLFVVVSAGLVAACMAMAASSAHAEPGPVPTPSPSTQSRTWAAPQLHLHLIR